MRTSRLLPFAIVGLALVLLAGCSRAKDDWNAAQSADTGEAYQDFLQQHPDSEYAVQAQARLKQLAEDRDWQQAAAADKPEAYEQFVAQHADSKWAQEARVRIENFNLTGGGQATPAPAEATGSSPVAPGVSGSAGPAAATPAAAPAAAPAPKPAAPKPAAAPSEAGSHLVQLGAFSTRARAESDWRQLQSKFAADLQGLKPRYVAGQSQGKPVVRLQVGLATAQRATTLCASLKKHGQACVPAS